MCASTAATVQPAGIGRFKSASLIRAISRRSRSRSASVSTSCERSCFSMTSSEIRGERTRRWPAGGRLQQRRGLLSERPLVGGPSRSHEGPSEEDPGAAQAPSRDRTRTQARGPLDRDEVSLASELDELGRELGRLEEEARGGTEVLNQVARVARAQRNVPLARVRGDPLGGLRIERDLLRLAHAAQDLRELLLRRRLDLDLVLDAPQERLIHQRRGRAVRREDEEHVERHLDLATVGEREEVDVAVERDDPSVEEHLGRGALPAEVVDEQHAPARLHLERRLMHLGVLVEGEIEVLERELATDLDERTRDRDPTAV